MARYGCMVLMFLFGCTLIVGKLAKTTIIEADAWNERASKEMADTSIIYPIRGSILSCNGNILACNQTPWPTLWIHITRVSRMQKSP